TGTPYINANIIRLPQTVTVVSNGSQVAQTMYGYDESTPQPSNITTQHTTPSGPRANLTSVNKWLNTTNSFLPHTITWFDTGEIYQSLDPLSHPTTNSYSAANAGAYPTAVCNALNQCVNTTFDFNTGLVTHVLDVNNNPTDYTYDAML